MKVKPKRLTEQTREFVPDEKKPDEIISYTFVPLDTKFQMYIGSINILTIDEEPRPDKAGAAFDTIGFALKSVTGLNDVNDEGQLIPFVLEFKNRKIGKRSHQRVTDECLNRIPIDVIADMITEINESASLTVEEVENINFTPDSQPLISPGAKTANEKSETPETREPNSDALTSIPTNSVEDSIQTEASTSGT